MKMFIILYFPCLIFFTKCKFFPKRTESSTYCSHQRIILAQRRKNDRAHYWAPIIARERSTVLSIAWYIGVELLRTKQLPQFMTHTTIHRVPTLLADIHNQAAKVYTEIFRTDDTVNKFYVADTGNHHIDGKVGVILSYDTDRCDYVTRIEGTGHGRNVGGSDRNLLPENMEPYRRVYTPTHMPCPSSETCTIHLQNHFSHTDSVSPCLTFHSDIFTRIGGISASPHTGGQAQRDMLVELIKTKEMKLRTEVEKIQSQQEELERGLSRMYSTHSPVLSRPRKKERVTQGTEELKGRALQVRSVWKAKIEHLVSITKDRPQRVERDHNGVHEHMFTYPFITVDNSLHQSCSGLPEFSRCSGPDGLNDAAYGRNDIASSIIIDGSSVSSVAPGQDMDDNIMNFCLSW